MYLAFEECAAMGAAVDETAFPRLEFLAEKKLDRYTQGRIRNMKVIPEAVKRCVADLIAAIGKADKARKDTAAPVAGFSNDGYSVTYAAPLTAETLDAELYGIICDYLASEKDDNGIPLLYLGVE